MRAGRGGDQPCVLMIADDTTFVETFAPALRAHGFDVAHERSADLAVGRVRDLQPDAVLLDLTMPGTDGCEVCKAVREAYEGAIVALTPWGRQLDHVRALEYGADDLLSSRVDPLVLLAHLNAVLRRTRPRASAAASLHSLRFGKLVIDRISRTALVRGREIALTAAEFDLLWLLASRAGEIVSRVELRATLRRLDDGAVDRAYDTQICHLRRIVGDDAGAPRGIKTVRGRGYLFNPDGWD